MNEINKTNQKIKRNLRYLENRITIRDQATDIKHKAIKQYLEFNYVEDIDKLNFSDIEEEVIENLKDFDLFCLNHGKKDSTTMKEALTYK